MEDGQSYRYIRRWEVASCNLCQTYGKTELLGIKTPVAECFQISHVYNYPNNTNSETYECECFFSHYLNVKTNQCEDVESIGIIPPLINYFLNIPMLIIAFVIAYRLYINKATEFWRKNPQYKNNKKKLNPAMKAALIACIFLFFRIIRSLGFIYFGSLFINVLSIVWVLPCIAGIIIFYTFGEITRKQLVNRKRQMRNNRIESGNLCCNMNISVNGPLCLKNVLNFTIFGILITSLVCVVASETPGKKKIYRTILKTYINTYGLGLFSSLIILFIVIYTFRVGIILKTTHSQLADGDKSTRSTYNRSDEILRRIKIMFFYMYMLVAYMLILLVQMYICDILGKDDEVSTYFLRKRVTCRSLFRFLDLILTIVITRSIEGTYRSLSMPWLFPGYKRRWCKCSCISWNQNLEDDISDSLINNSEMENNKTGDIKTEFSSIIIKESSNNSINSSPSHKKIKEDATRMKIDFKNSNSWRDTDKAINNVEAPPNLNLTENPMIRENMNTHKK